MGGGQVRPHGGNPALGGGPGVMGGPQMGGNPPMGGGVRPMGQGPVVRPNMPPPNTGSLFGGPV